MRLVYRRWRSLLGMRALEGNRGQMVVELAVVLPAVLALAIAAVNVCWYLEAAALFDRISLDSVIVRASSPSGDQKLSGVEGDVRQLIEMSMYTAKRTRVSVTSRSLGASPQGRAQFTLAPHLREYTCTMTYTAWPASFSVAGFAATPPFEVKKTKRIVVDPYRTGVVV